MNPSVLPKYTCGRKIKYSEELGDFSQVRDFASKPSSSEIYFRRMGSDAQKRILDAFLVAMRPIARMLLRYGVGYREFAEVAKTAFVDVATSDYGIRGRPTNISRVAVMTGLTRKEVRRIRDQLDRSDREYTVKIAPLAYILFKWHTDTNFLGSDGRPLRLPFAGDGKSFTELVRKYGGDIPPGAMRTELKRIGAIEEDDEGNVVAIRRDVHPPVALDNLCMTLVHAAYPLLENIAHNTDPNRTAETWPQATAYVAAIPDSDLVRLRRICRDRTTNSAESVDDLLEVFADRDDPNDQSREKEGRPVAVGFYYFEEYDKDRYSVWQP